MNSLRVRIALILIASIVLVVGLATAVAVLVGRPNGNRNYIRPIAEQITYLERLVAEDPGHEVLRGAPVGGASREDIAVELRKALHRLGADWPVAVNQPKGATLPIASVAVGQAGWLALPIPEPAPSSDALLVVGGWMLLILLGTAVVSLGVAHRVTRPLLLLEGVAARVGLGDALELVPEDGPAEVRATARALNRLSRNLRRAMESRMRLVAAAGHDLRTPLTRMRLRAEFLNEAERVKWLGNIDELERIAESAIALVREEAGHLDGTALRLDLLAGEIVADLTLLGLRVGLGEVVPAEVKGPRLALTRALRNLITNAATHGGGARISLGEEAGSAVLTIDDEGPGIPEPLIERVFEPFFRVDQARRQAVAGAGLGLAIAREIIHRAGGTLVIRNKPQGGLRQIVTFRLHEGDRRPAAVDRGPTE